MRAIINKEKQKMNNERKYVFSKEGVDIVTQAGATHNYWSSFVNKGEIENHIYLVRKDNKVILINKMFYLKMNYCCLEVLFKI